MEAPRILGQPAPTKIEPIPVIETPEKKSEPETTATAEAIEGVLAREAEQRFQVVRTTSTIGSPGSLM